MDIVAMIQDNDLLPAKRLGPVICVTVFENSSHAKARSLSCRLCAKCVEIEGLTGIGKKGVSVGAKTLSEAKIPDNRAAALDLMGVVLAKMNGDIQRLGRICGPNLSDKARDLLKEHWTKINKFDAGAETPHKPRSNLAAPTSTRIVESVREANEPANAPVELPRLSLRETYRGDSPRRSERDTNPPLLSTNSNETGDSESRGSGAAASLRERLLKIRDKASICDETTLSQDSEDLLGYPEEITYDDCLRRLNALLSLTPPVREDEKELHECIDTLKRFHSALSKQHLNVAGLSAAELAELRVLIANNMSETVECLTWYV
jgi:hypothetical protein